MKATCHKDALNKDIVIGDLYGWSDSTNGFTTAWTGIALKLTENRVSVQITSKRRSLYDNEPEVKTDHKKTTTIRGMRLFPVNIIV